jgi:hypothetical protein
MTRLDKCKLLKEKGYTYNSDTGEIFNRFNRKITKKTIKGYISINGNKNFNGELYGHHFAWYMIYDNVEFDLLDHINQDRSDNRICNLRISNHQQNRFNSNTKGYTWNKNGWESYIKFNGKQTYLGRYKTEEEARQAYLLAKEKYHII